MYHFKGFWQIASSSIVHMHLIYSPIGCTFWWTSKLILDLIKKAIYYTKSFTYNLISECLQRGLHLGRNPVFRQLFKQCRYNSSIASNNFNQSLAERNAAIKEAGTWKDERVITSKQGAEIDVKGSQNKILNFCANNYLGLSVSIAVKRYEVVYVFFVTYFVLVSRHQMIWWKFAFLIFAIFWPLEF